MILYLLVIIHIASGVVFVGQKPDLYDTLDACQRAAVEVIRDAPVRVVTACAKVRLGV